MAGTIIADTLTHSTAGSVTTDFVVNGSAKAWVNGTATASINNSFNCSSGTDHGTGDYSITLTNAFSAVTYAMSAMARTTTAGFIVTRNPDRDEATVLAIEIDTDASTQSDSAFEINAHGDLA